MGIICSNASKFTPSGGTITLTTKLLYPAIPSNQDQSFVGAPSQKPSENLKPSELSAAHLDQHNFLPNDSSRYPEYIVVRIEVQDAYVSPCITENK